MSRKQLYCVQPIRFEAVQYVARDSRAPLINLLGSSSCIQIIGRRDAVEPRSSRAIFVRIFQFPVDVTHDEAGRCVMVAG